MLSVEAGEYETVDSEVDVELVVIITVVGTTVRPLPKRKILLLSMSSAEPLSRRTVRADLYTVAGAYPGQIYC